MAINISKYVNITSGIGASTLVNTRDYIARVFTTNIMLPPSSFIEKTSAELVGNYFGTASEEFKRSQSYFSFISKSITSPNKISFARWVDVSVPPFIFGQKNINVTVADFTSITDGSFILTIGPDTHLISSLDFTTALSFSDVADIIEFAINSAQVDPVWSSATVTFDSGTKSFNFVGGDDVAFAISVLPGNVGTNISNLIGWNSQAIYCTGALAESLTTCLTNSSNMSNNFGSFTFTTATALDITQNEEIATWNSTNNIFYIYHKVGTIANASSDYSAIGQIGGTVNTISEISTEYPEMFVMAVQAATSYENKNSTVNYMFQMFPGITPSVTDTAVALGLDDLKANYYGNTQTAGQLVSFYQNGVMYGPASFPSDINVYANEIWFKDAASSSIMNLLLGLEKISANSQGRSQIISVLQTVINQALLNGTISVGKTLNITQQLYITQITNDQNSWRQIQNIGYWLNVIIEQISGQFVAVYTIVYSKDDVVRKVNGTHVLI